MKVADMSAEQKVEYMTTEPIPRLVSQMAVPTIISMLVTSFYNMVDTMFVGRINTQSTAAVGIVFSDGNYSGVWVFLWTRIGQLYFQKTGRTEF